jgi:hypothetical protein
VVLTPPVIDRGTPSSYQTADDRVLLISTGTDDHPGDTMTAQQLVQPIYSSVPTVSAPVRRRTGRVVGVVAALVVLGALGAAALFLIGPRMPSGAPTLQPESMQNEIVRVTQTAVQVAPADLRCPEGVTARTGGTFTCTAFVDDQLVTYWVHQNDDKGNLTITYDRLLRRDTLEQALATAVSSDLDSPVTVACRPTGRTVLRNMPGQQVDCTATRAGGPAGGTRMIATVDGNGTAAYRFA